MSFPPFSAPPTISLSLEPSIFEFSNDLDQDLHAALSYWAELPAYDLDELYANQLPTLQPALPPPQSSVHTAGQYTQINYLQSPGYQHPPSLTRTYTLSPFAAIVDLQCLPPDHAFTAAHVGTQAFVVGPNVDHMPTQYLLHTPHADGDVLIITPNADPSIIASDAMWALRQHSVASADFFKTTAPIILEGACLSEPNVHLEDQLPIETNGASPYMGNSLALEDVDLRGLVPVSPTSGPSTPCHIDSCTSATFDSSATAAISSFYESLLFNLERNRMNGVIPLSSPTPSVNKNDTKFREEASSVDADGSEVITLRVKTENLDLEDGFTWRKYGRKDIKKAAFARSYLRCALRSDKGCKVLKRIQRCSHDPDCIDFTYTGRHNHALKSYMRAYHNKF